HHPADTKTITPSTPKQVRKGTATTSELIVPSCGSRPPHADPATTERYLGCKWRAGCLERLLQTRRMIDQGRENCSRSGNEQACRSYYLSLASQYQVGMCDKPP
ncbi:MAG: hypothetical protein HQL66_14280, partial [Magnetococcales bacterium]|nr:hypothetical protein [Magnetococcales bacterium]